MLHQQLKEDLKKAMQAKDSVSLNVVRGVISAVTNELVAEGKKPQEEAPDDVILKVIGRMAKQRKDSIDQFKKGNRNDLVESEEKELKIIEEYLPEQMSKEEIEKIVKAKKEKLKVEDRSKMGILMGAVMFELKGKADGKDVKKIVESLFQ